MIIPYLARVVVHCQRIHGFTDDSKCREDKTDRNDYTCPEIQNANIQRNSLEQCPLVSKQGPQSSILHEVTFNKAHFWTFKFPNVRTMKQSQARERLQCAESTFERKGRTIFEVIVCFWPGALFFK